jgi:hypothetical protein
MRIVKTAVVGVATGAVALGALTATVSAEAVVDETSVVTTCSTFSGVGTVDSPYDVVYVYPTGDNSVTLFSDTLATPDGGAISWDVTFEQQPAGTELSYLVWGNDTGEPEEWDDQAYFEVEVFCELAPEPTTTTTTTTPLEPVVPEDTTTTTAAAPATDTRVTPRFTG